MDTKGNGEFFANLTRYAGEQADQPLKFDDPDPGSSPG